MREARETAATAQSVVALAIGLALGPAVGQGLGRFAYALLLPAMRQELGWSYTQAGGMNTANAIGYLLGALGAAPVTTRLGSHRAFLGSILLTTLSLLGSSLTADYSALLVLRLASGVGGAVAFVAGAVLASGLASAHRARSGLVLGIFYGGVGLGIAASGALVPAILAGGTPGAWRLAWAALGAASLAALAGAALSTGNLTAAAAPLGLARGGWSPRAVAPALVGYFLYALGFVSYMTFVIAYLRERGEGAAALALFWAVLGCAALVSAVGCGPIIERVHAGRALAAAIAVVAVASVLPLISTAQPLMLLSGALFGGAFMPVTSTTTSLVRRALPPPSWTGGIAVFTVVFATGQTLGPILTGAVADWLGNLDSGLALSAAITLLGSLTCLAQRAGAAEPA